MINYIIYGHTDYLDILKIQTDYMSIYSNVTLLINNNELDLNDLYLKYKTVIFYDDNLQYSKRLIHCLNQITDKYLVFIHDIDIVLNIDEETIISFYKFMEKNDVDRVDLKQSHNLNVINVIEIDKQTSVDSWKIIKKEEINDGIYLVKQEDPKDFIYNVNPSIWKRESFMELLITFPDKTYRTIEDMDVQNYCKRFDVYKLFSKNSIECGYFTCLEIFKFLHISHSGKLLRLTNSFTTEHNQSYASISENYIDIVNKYNLKSSPKWVN
jgi:hypothetical protein